jgi:methylase of polypeptide subunit release factors
MFLQLQVEECVATNSYDRIFTTKVNRLCLINENMKLQKKRLMDELKDGHRATRRILRSAKEMTTEQGFFWLKTQSESNVELDYLL